MTAAPQLEVKGRAFGSGKDIVLLIHGEMAEAAGIAPGARVRLTLEGDSIRIQKADDPRPGGPT